MERRLKERLVGAGLLVAVIVLVVPELLSGPKPVAPVAPSSTSASLPGVSTGNEPIRTVTVDLNTQKTMAAATPPETEIASSAPPPSEAPLPAQQPASAMPEVATPPLKAVPPRPTPTPAPLATIENQASSSKSWLLQLGSFANRANAEQMVRTVKAHDFPAYLSASGVGKSLRYRVRVGPLADRSAAEKMRVRLKREGHIASVVAP